jgi:choline monooxygenase
MRLDIDADIRRALTLPSAIYYEPSWYERQREHVFARSWQLCPDAALVATPTPRCRPWTLLPGCLDEPLLLVRDEAGVERCLTNVCTHRGNLLIDAPCDGGSLRCGYHGRTFALDGHFLRMPEFDGAEAFPRPEDSLRQVAWGRLGPLGFAALAPPVDLEELLAPVRARLSWMPLERLAFDAATSRDYELEANWALYCDNYLEGFHVPYVHPTLSRALDYPSYDTELFAGGVLQIGVGTRGEPELPLPADHVDAGRHVAAYYLWLFPNTMFNVYPWGLSINVVLPQGPARTRVAFRSYVMNAAARGAGAGTGLHEVEMEDEAVVLSVQRGVRSRSYDRGRYSPRRERGVHHFHRLLAAALQ